jgi:hypothetical protein
MEIQSIPLKNGVARICYCPEMDIMGLIACIPSPGGLVKVRMSMNLKPIEAMIAQKAGVNNAETGRRKFGRRFKKFAKRMTGITMLKRLSKLSKKIAKNPFMKKIGKLATKIPGYGPMIKQGFSIANKVNSTVDRLSRGSRRARDGVRRLRRQAEGREGAALQPRAQGMLNMVRRQYQTRYGMDSRGRLRRGARASGVYAGYHGNTLGYASEQGAVAGAMELWGPLRVLDTKSPVKSSYQRGLQAMFA